MQKLDVLCAFLIRKSNFPPAFIMHTISPWNDWFCCCCLRRNFKIYFTLSLRHFYSEVGYIRSVTYVNVVRKGRRSRDVEIGMLTLWKAKKCIYKGKRKLFRSGIQHLFKPTAISFDLIFHWKQFPHKSQLLEMFFSTRTLDPVAPRQQKPCILLLTSQCVGFPETSQKDSTPPRRAETTKTLHYTPDGFCLVRKRRLFPVAWDNADVIFKAIRVRLCGNRG